MRLKGFGKNPLFRVILIACAILMPVFHAQAEPAIHHGYTDNVAEERLQVSHEIVILPLAQNKTSSVFDKIFTDKLTKEFRQEFRRQFGFTEFEQLEFTSNRIVESSDSGRQLQFEEYNEKEEKFGRYIGKELAEFHVDNYLKSNRNTRVVYQVKEKVSNVNIDTKSGYKFKLRYKLTNDRLRLLIQKDDEIIHKSFDMKSNGEELTARFGYDLNRTVQLGTNIGIVDEFYTLQAIKSLGHGLSTSIAGQSFTKDFGSTPKQNRVLLGLSWSD